MREFLNMFLLIGRLHLRHSVEIRIIMYVRNSLSRLVKDLPFLFVVMQQSKEAGNHQPKTKITCSTKKQI